MSSILLYIALRRDLLVCQYAATTSRHDQIGSMLFDIKHHKFT